MKKIYQQYSAYNLWANQRLTDLFRTLAEEETNRLIENSFPSVKKTILHIWDAEHIWLKRIQGVMVQSFPSQNFKGTTIGAIEGMLAISKAFHEKVGSFSDEELNVSKTITKTTGDKYIHTNREMIHHCMNHSTYHRGQLIMMARQLGLRDLPATDMIVYLRENGKGTGEK